MKNYKVWIGIIAYLAGMYMSRAVGSYYGLTARAVFAYIAFTILVILMVYYLIKKKYLETARLLSVVLPLFILFLGIFLDSLYLAFGGAASFLITIPIMIKVNAKYGNDRPYR